MVAGLGRHQVEAVEHARGAVVLGHQVQGQVGGGQAAQNEKEHLNNVGEANHLHAAQGNNYGKTGQRVHAEGQVQARDAAHGNGPEVENGGEVDHDVERQPENGHNHGHRAVVALAEELRHRENAVLQVHRNEEYGHHDEREGGHPFVGGNGQAHFKARARHAHKLLGRDVGGDERRADGPPGERAFGQEIVFGIALGGAVVAGFAPVNPDAVARYNQKVNEEDDVVERSELIH